MRLDQVEYLVESRPLLYNSGVNGSLGRSGRKKNTKGRFFER